jgi:tetratricopeptide (TPR) repeat protein
MSSNCLKIKKQGNSEFKIGHYITAIDYYTRAIELNPNDHSIIFK